MLIKRLSKIGLTLLLAVSFIVPSTFNARADFTSTDSTNLRNVAEDTSNIYTRVGTTNTHLNNINTKLTNIYNDVSSIKNAVTNTIATTINTISTTLTSIKGYVDGLEGYVDGVETKLDSVIGALATSNSNWVSAGNYLDAIYQTLSTSDSTNTDIYNLLNTYTNTYIASIDKTLAVISDNIVVDRWVQNASNISVNSPAGNTYSYALVKHTYYSPSVSLNSANVPQITWNNLERYGNFRGTLRVLLLQLPKDLFNSVFNTILLQNHLLSLDTEYIGEESHLIYQNLDSFKSANHNDLTNINTTLNTWLNFWKPWAKNYYVLIDNVTKTRLSDTQDVITVPTFDGNVEYYLNRNDVWTITYDAQTHSFVRNNLERYSNFNGMLYRYSVTVYSYFWAYYQYLNDNSVANSISNNVAALDQNLTQLETAESAVTTDAITKINNFLPDPSQIGSLAAISWGSNFLQRLFVALGAFNIPIMCALVLSVCMQFIGYFKYKS